MRQHIDAAGRAKRHDSAVVGEGPRCSLEDWPSVADGPRASIRGCPLGGPEHQYALAEPRLARRRERPSMASGVGCRQAIDVRKPFQNDLKVVKKPSKQALAAKDGRIRKPKL